ncbi:MAG: hypothetical protein HRT81_11870 [Henriciella sp.]|nr:hypothetical protein [Henriciella sp.]
MKTYLLGIAALFFVAACGNDAASPKARIAVAAAPAVTAPVERVDETPVLTLAAEETIAEIRDVLERDSLNRLVRLADREENFVSNFAGESHKVHWDLLRRTGFDPLHRLGELLDGPYGTRQVGDQTWFIWPDFAARDAPDLLPEKLSFTDRARLADLVGEPGLARIRAGQDYPGIRTAIAEDGRWLYFVHETIEATEADN